MLLEIWPLGHLIFYISRLSGGWHAGERARGWTVGRREGGLGDGRMGRRAGERASGRAASGRADGRIPHGLLLSALHLIPRRLGGHTGAIQSGVKFRNILDGHLTTQTSRRTNKHTDTYIQTNKLDGLSLSLIFLYLRQLVHRRHSNNSIGGGKPSRRKQDGEVPRTGKDPPILRQ